MVSRGPNADKPVARSVVATKRSRASREVRREQLINTTIDTLARRGFGATTLAEVAQCAGLSRGIVNFHFDSKERLLLETLNYMNEAYRLHWHQAYTEAGDDPAVQLRALISADLDEAVCSPRLVAAWFAFFAEAKSNPTYQTLCWTRDDHYLGFLSVTCRALKSQGSYAFDPELIATAIYCAQEGLWLRLMLGDGEFTRRAALNAALAMLAQFFPRHYDEHGALLRTE